MVAEKTVKMTGVEYPAEGFSESVRRVDHTGDVGKEDITTVFPDLDGEHLDVNVTAAFSRDAMIDHVDGRCIVLVNGSRLELREAKLSEDGSKIENGLGGRYSSNKFRLS
jgi:hypothetical protein